MKIVALSDLHGFLPSTPECDLLLVAGDVCPVLNHKPRFQRAWLDREFRGWLESRPARKIVGVWGNHDLLAEREPLLVPDLPWTVLTDELLEWEGLHIYGLPWQLRFFDWAFNLDEPELSRKYDAIPDCDVIVSHGPPFGSGDLAPGGGHVGSRAFLDAIARIQPRLAVFGHIHEGGGFRYQLGRTTLANVSILDGQYRLAHEAFETTLELEVACD